MLQFHAQKVFFRRVLNTRNTLTSPFIKAFLRDGDKNKQLPDFASVEVHRPRPESDFVELAPVPGYFGCCRTVCRKSQSPSLHHAWHLVDEVFKKKGQEPQTARQPRHRPKAEVPLRHCSHCHCTCRCRLGIPCRPQVVSRNHSNGLGHETNRTGTSQYDPHTCLWP